MATLDEDIFSLDDGNWVDQALDGYTIQLVAGQKEYVNTSNKYDIVMSYRNTPKVGVVDMTHELDFTASTNSKAKIQIQTTPTAFHLEGFGVEIGDFGSGLAITGAEKGSLPETPFRPDDIGAGDQFGFSVDSDNGLIIAGSPLEDGVSDLINASGAAYVFKKFGSNYTEKFTLRASNGGTEDHFGNSVAISGNTIVVGAPDEDGPTDSTSGVGAVYIFITDDDGETWTEQAILRPSDPTTNKKFGFHVDISIDTVVVGAPGDNSNTGAAYIFKRTGTSWSQEQKLIASNAGSNDEFGTAVSVDGDICMVGSPSEDGVGNSVPNSGAVYAFTRSSSVWTERQILRAVGDGGPQILAIFGRRVAFRGDVVFVGSPARDVGGMSNNGAVHAFRTTDGGLTWTEIFFDSGDEDNDSLGSSVAFRGNIAAAGITGDDGTGNAEPGSGAIRIYERTAPTTFMVVRDSRPEELEDDDFFGFSVTVDGSEVIGGAALGDDGPDNLLNGAGAVYILPKEVVSSIPGSAAELPLVSSTQYKLIWTLLGSGSFKVEIEGGVYASPTLIATSDLGVSGNFIGLNTRLSINVAQSG